MSAIIVGDSTVFIKSILKYFVLIRDDKKKKKITKYYCTGTRIIATTEKIGMHDEKTNTN